MNIKNEVWDNLVSEALELAEYIETYNSSVLIPGKTRCLALLYTLIHLENSQSEMEEIIESISRLEKIIKISKKKVSKVKRKI